MVEGLTGYSHLSHDHSFTSDRIGMISIPTKDRPEALRRLLESFKPEDFIDYKGSIVVADSSVKEANATQDVVHEFSQKLSCPVLYRTPNDTKRMIQHIASEVDIDIETLTISFLGHKDFFSAGSVRNQFLLFQNGKSSIQIDDDIILSYKQHQDYSPSITITPDNPLNVTTYTEAEDIEKELIPVTKNPLQMYEDFFNQLENDSRSKLNNLADDFLTKRMANPLAHILHIQNGLYGDSSVKRFFAVQQLLKKNSDLFSAGEETYNLQKHSTHVIQSPLSPTITDNTLCTTSYIAIAGSHLFPPFPPIGRGEDFLAGVLASQCCVGSLFIHLGTLVMHKRDTILPVSNISTLALPPSNRILAALIGQHSYTGNTNKNIEDAGKLILEFSLTKQNVFEEYLAATSKKIWAASIIELEQVLSSHRELPQFWQKDIELYIEELKTSYTASTGEIINRVGNPAVWSALQKSYCAYGRLLTKWPEMWTTSLSVNHLEV